MITCISHLCPCQCLEGAREEIDSAEIVHGGRKASLYVLFEEIALRILPRMLVMEVFGRPGCKTSMRYGIRRRARSTRSDPIDMNYGRS